MPLGQHPGGPSLFAPSPFRDSIVGEVDDQASANAAARRAALARALMERARESYQGAERTGAWNALPGLAPAIAAMFMERGR